MSILAARVFSKKKNSQSVVLNRTQPPVKRTFTLNGRCLMQLLSALRGVTFSTTDRARATTAAPGIIFSPNERKNNNNNNTGVHSF